MAANLTAGQRRGHRHAASREETMDAATNRLARNIRRVAHLDLPGGGQVVVQDGYAYVGHMKPPYGTTILDVRDPKNPRIVSEIRLGDDTSHTHKVRVVGDLMITNVEQNRRHFLRKGERLPELRKQLTAELGRAPEARSEEHTSELQSLMRISYAVFCLKKKNTQHCTNT